MPGVILFALGVAGVAWKLLDSWSVVEFGADKIGRDRLKSLGDGAWDVGTAIASSNATLVVVLLGGLAWLLVAGSKHPPVAEPNLRPNKETLVVLEHDGMEWVYAGKKEPPKGPRCVDDHTPLAFVDTKGHGSPVVPYFRKDSAHMGGYWGYLRCLTCGREYGKDEVKSYKTVEQSQIEVRQLFDGMENRGEV